MKSFVCFIGLTICRGKPYALFKLLLVRMKRFRNLRRLAQSVLRDAKMIERCTVDGETSVTYHFFLDGTPGSLCLKALNMTINVREINKSLKCRFCIT